MIFVISYDRKDRRVLVRKTFADDSRNDAMELRRELERSVAKRSEVEVVVLDAPNEAALRRTHGKYFGNLTELFDKAPD